jgi:hypothetical protein
MVYAVRFLLVISSLIVLVLTSQYFFCPRIQFSKPAPFHGSKWYNPYAGTQPRQWMKCNFHAHTNSWNSVTNGHGKAADVWARYNQLGYAVHCVSDYQKINSAFSDRSNYVPAYEHGYNVSKTHQLVIGGKEVAWPDFLLPQTRSNKQWVLDRLNENNESVVVLNHPDMRHGYTMDDMAYLHGFDCIEVLNPQATSFAVWDAALSAGKPVFITANDDLHNIFHPEESGRFCTWLNAATANRQAVIHALKLGRGFGMRVGTLLTENAAQRTQRIRERLPCLEWLHMQGDTLSLCLNGMAAEIRFIGQQGRTIKTVSNATKAEYVAQKQDPYIRAAAFFPDGTEIYLNPVFRYTNQPFAAQFGHSIDVAGSVIFYLAGVLILVGWFSFVASRFRPRGGQVVAGQRIRTRRFRYRKGTLGRA